MSWIDRFDLFLFDLDGLLVDTEKLHFESYQILCSRYGKELPWSFAEYIGVAHGSASGLQTQIHPLLSSHEESWETLYTEKKRIYLELLNKGSLQLMPGVEKLLEELSFSRVKRCVVTHSAKEQVERIKTILPALGSIPVWITREDYEDPKPAPDGYLRAIELLADPGDRIVGFEDSLRGFQSLKSANALPVLICDGAHPQLKQDELRGEIHYPSFSAIPKKPTLMR